VAVEGFFGDSGDVSYSEVLYRVYNISLYGLGYVKIYTNMLILRGLVLVLGLSIFLLRALLRRMVLSLLLI